MPAIRRFVSLLGWTSSVAATISFVFSTSARAAEGDAPPYEIVRSDGTRAEAKSPPVWIARESDPQHEGKSLLDGPQALRRWYRVDAGAQAQVAERVELVGGDRLTGRIVSYLPEATDGIDRPAVLVVEPELAVDEPRAEQPLRVRIPLERIRRVVWEESTPRPYRPGTFFYRDGRRTTFRSLRWSAESLRLLVEQGVEEVSWDDAAEVHLPLRDAWEDYADRLAVDSPNAVARLALFETPGGTRITAALGRLRATGDVAKPESQSFALYPAWSLDPIVVPQRLVTAETFFAEHEVPLSNCEPTSFVHRPIVGGGWNRWRADRNVQGGSLTVGDDRYGWGFGVHAFAALEFDLPPWARGFRTRAALDRAAGEGGSVRARVFFGPAQTASAPSGRPLYESPLIIGSAAPLDTGRLELKPQGGRANKLVLQCDSLAGEALPPQADPLDLRDLFDWLEPIVELDSALLRTAVAKHAASLFVRRHHWTLQGPYGETWRWDHAWAGARLREVVVLPKTSLVMVRTLEVAADCEALHVKASAVDPAAGPVIATVTMAGQKLGGVRLADWTDPVRPPNMAYSVPANLRGREQRCELTITAEKPNAKIEFFGVQQVVPAPPAAK